MTVKTELSIVDFKAWQGGEDTKYKIIEADRVEDFDSMIEEQYPDGLTDTELNDLLWFESEWIFESLGIPTEDEEEEDEE